MRYLAIRFRRRSGRHASAATAHRRRIRGVALLGVLAGLVVVLAPAGSAKPPTAMIKLYDACLTAVSGSCSTSSLHLGDNSLTFTITNENGSNTTLGSANLDAPAGFTLSPVSPAVTLAVTVYDASANPVSSATPTGSIVTLSSGVNELQLRNLNLSNGWHATVSFTATASSACMATWGIAAKQSNDFNGNGNDFQLVTSAGLTSSVAGGCRLAFLYEPASAHPSTPISDTPYTQATSATNATTAGPHYVTVVATDGTNVLTSVSGVTVTLSMSAGTFDTSGTFSGNSATLTNGYAAFPTLQTNGTGSGFTLTASAGASSPFAPATSTPPFDIIADTTACDPTAPCPLSGVDSGGNPLDIVASTNFTFLGLNSYTPPTSTSGGVTTVTTPGCQNLIPVSGTGFAEYDGRSGSGTLTVTIYVDMKKIKAQYGQNTGQQFIPMCIGVRPVDLTTNVAHACSASDIWEGDAIDSSSGKSVFTGSLAWSVCGSDGYSWGIVSSFQDKYDTNPPQNYPEVTAWTTTTIGNKTYREFTLSVPPGWDVKGIN